jgi:SAM-dependent methyltransferase
LTLTSLDPEFAFEGGGCPALECLLADRLMTLPSSTRKNLDTAIHARDEMLEYAYLHEGGDFESGLLSYFRSACEIVEAQRQLAQWWFGGWDRVESFLDFGCGYGRPMRFLSRELDPSRIFVSDLYQEALHYQADRYGVQPLLSSSNPDELEVGRKFDYIWVGSLFTHLPERSFGPWLRRLRSLLNPGGLLAFSTHHARLIPPGHSLPESGLFFHGSSESHSHDLAEYGSTWVSEAFVERLVSEIDDSSHYWSPRALVSYQDLVVVVPTSGRCTKEVGSPVDGANPFDGFSFDSGPRAAIERVNSEKPGQLILEGWATYAGQSPRHRVEQIEVVVDGETVGGCSSFGQRHDLVEILGSEEALESAWSCRCQVPVPLSKSRATLIVKAHSSSGRSTVLWCSSIDRAESYFNRQNWESSKRQVARLEQHIEWMENSRFWRLRNRWFTLKRALGLTEES